MTAYLQEFISLLTQQPGNLIYYIVLAFSVAASLPTAWTFAHAFEHPYAGRVLLGLIPVLFVLLVSFLIGSLSWQGIMADHNLLPALDRGVTLFSLVLIIWLWAYPEPVRFADMATLLLILAIISLTAVNIAWWSYQSNPAPYNSVPAERISQVIALICIVIGIVQLILRRPQAWANGFFMLVILFSGHLFQLLFPNWQGNYAGPVRLAQIVAYPILLTLPQRFISTSKKTSQPNKHVRKEKSESSGEGLDSNQVLTGKENLPESLAHLLQQKKAQEELQEGYQKMRQSYQVLEIDLEHVQQEKQDLLAQLAEAQVLISENAAKSNGTTPYLTMHEQDQAAMAGIKVEIEQMNHALNSSSAEKDILAGELKLALEEVARLRSITENEGENIIEKSSSALTENQMGYCLQAMLQARQPLSAITGYSDLLLGESIGALSDLQRRFLERIRSVTEQMTAILDEVQKLTQHGDPSLKLDLLAFPLSEVVDGALLNNSEILKSKGITVRSDLPESLPRLRIDRHVVEQVITSLIRKASNATPMEGQISLHAERKGDTEDGDYVLFQVADQGGGIAAEDIPELFSGSPTSISDVGDMSTSWSKIKELIETSGGWIWEDSEPGVGTIISILLPASRPLSGSETQDGEWNLEV
jgi:signal transduction histidine kinase